MSTWADIDRYLSGLGIRIGTPTIGQTVGGVHAPGSYHYQGRARDYGSMTSDMRAVWDALLPFVSGPIIELFGPWGAWKAGRDIGYVAGHTDHVHAAIAADGVLEASQPIPVEPERKPCLIRLSYPPPNGSSLSFQRRPARATGSSLRTEPSSHSETPAISAVSSYRRTCSPNDHDRPEHGWTYDPNGWEPVDRW